MSESSVRTVDTEVTYLAPGSFVNRRFVCAGVEANTGEYRSYPVQVRDGREIQDRFTLDEHGFVLAEHQSRVKDFLDRDEVDAVYPGEVEQLVKDLTGASHVVLQGWMVRTPGKLAAKKKVVGYRHRGGVQPPAGEAHVDFTPEFAEVMARKLFGDHFPGERPYRRFISLSLWRCFSPPPQDWPLAVCDGRSVGPDEGTPNTLVVVDELPDREGMLAEIPGEERLPRASIFHFNPDHRWWYFSNMHRDEVLLFKFCDSDVSKVRRVPHTAFFDPSFPDAHTRHSIEYRLVAFYMD